MIRASLFLAALAVSAPSWSAVTLSQFPPNPGVLPGGGWKFTPGTTFADPTPPRAWVNGVYGGVPAAVVTDTFSLKGPAAGALSVAVSTAATVPSIAAALARVAARAHLPLSVGMAAYDFLSSQGVRQGDSGAEIDLGVSPTEQTTTQYCFQGPQQSLDDNGLRCGPTKSAGCSLAVAAVPTADSNYVYPGTTVRNAVYSESPNPKCSYQESDPRHTENGVKYWIDRTLPYRGGVTQTSNGCSPVTDALTGQSHIPGTYSDGKCITGRYTAATAAQVVARVTPGVQADPPAAAKAATESGASIDSSPYSVTGPASQTGTPTSTTTTGPAGTSTVTTTPTYAYTYTGDTINVTTTNTTNTTNITNEGDTTTTTTTTSTPGNDDKGMCSLYPDSLACMTPGTPPEAEPVPIDRRPVTITKDSRWGANSGACTRGAIQLSTGVSINIWKPFCDFFTLIHGVVVGMFGLVGALIFRNGVK